MDGDEQLVQCRELVSETRCKTSTVCQDKYLVDLEAFVAGRLTSVLKGSPAYGGVELFRGLATQPQLRAQSHAADGLNNQQALREAMME